MVVVLKLTKRKKSKSFFPTWTKTWAQWCLVFITWRQIGRHSVSEVRPLSEDCTAPALAVLWACRAPHCCLCWHTYANEPQPQCSCLSPRQNASGPIYLPLTPIEIHLWNHTKQRGLPPWATTTHPFVSSRLWSNFRLVFCYFILNLPHILAQWLLKGPVEGCF